MLMCEGKINFWKETASSFQVELPCREVSTSSVVADTLNSSAWALSLETGQH